MSLKIEILLEATKREALFIAESVKSSPVAPNARGSREKFTEFAESISAR